MYHRIFFKFGLKMSNLTSPHRRFVQKIRYFSQFYVFTITGEQINIVFVIKTINDVFKSYWFVVIFIFCTCICMYKSITAVNLSIVFESSEGYQHSVYDLHYSLVESGLKPHFRFYNRKRTFFLNTLSFHLKTYHTLWDPGLPSSGDDWGTASWWACGPLEFGDPHVWVPGWKASLWGRDKHRYLQKNNKSWFAFPSFCIWRGQGSYIKSKWNSYGNFYLNIFYDQKSPCKTCCRGCTSLPT